MLQEEDYVRKLAAGAMVVAVLVVAAAATANAPQLGNETINYTYDARGRLVRTQHSGSVNNNVQANYAYDKADNRETVNRSP